MKARIKPLCNLLFSARECSLYNFMFITKLSLNISIMIQEKQCHIFWKIEMKPLKLFSQLESIFSLKVCSAKFFMEIPSNEGSKGNFNVKKLCGNALGLSKPFMLDLSTQLLAGSTQNIIEPLVDFQYSQVQMHGLPAVISSISITRDMSAQLMEFSNIVTCTLLVSEL